MYHVNWFRRDAQGKFLWPGFGDNLRVLSWILERCAGRGGASDTPIGSLPRPSDLNLAGLDIDPAALGELLSVDKELWKVEATELHSYMDEFGERIPAALRAELHALEQRLSLP